MNGSLYVLRTGGQWNARPKELGSGQMAHRDFQPGVRAGVFLRMWPAGLTEYDELKGLDWKWPAADGAMTKALRGGEKTGKNPPDRRKLGTKRSVLVTAPGLPVGWVVSGANTPEGRWLEATRYAVPVDRPAPATPEPHGGVDQGHSGEPCTTVGEAAGAIVHVPDKANAKKNVSGSLGGARRGGGSAKLLLHGSIAFAAGSAVGRREPATTSPGCISLAPSSVGVSLRVRDRFLMLRAVALLPFLRELQRFDITSHPATSVACYLAA